MELKRGKGVSRPPRQRELPIHDNPERERERERERGIKSFAERLTKLAMDRKLLQIDSAKLPLLRLSRPPLNEETGSRKGS